MFQFYVIEIQKLSDDQYAYLVHDDGNDADYITALNKAKSVYHTVLAAAAISTIPQHSALLIDSNGNYLANETFSHEVSNE